MPKDTSQFKPPTRRCSPEEKAAAVRMVRTLRAELGTDHGTVKRVATQVGCGAESVRSWVRQADVDEGHVAGVSTSEAARMKALKQENRELKRPMRFSRGQRVSSGRSSTARTGRGCVHRCQP